jgi:hypothetical protein
MSAIMRHFFDPGSRCAVIAVMVIILTCQPAFALPLEREKLLPPRGKTVVLPNTAATPEHLDVFRRVTGHTPTGHKFWMNLDDPDYVKLHEEMVPYNRSLMITLLFGKEPRSGGELAPQSRHLSRVVSGELDEALEKLGKELRAYGRPLYLDIGNEAEFFYPKHPKQFVMAYKHVHDKLEPLCPNVLFFWHTVTVSSAKTKDWNPGDRFVHGIGLSLYSDVQFRRPE